MHHDARGHVAGPRLEHNDRSVRGHDDRLCSALVPERHPPCVVVQRPGSHCLLHDRGDERWSEPFTRRGRANDNERRGRAPLTRKFDEEEP